MKIDSKSRPRKAAQSAGRSAEKAEEIGVTVTEADASDLAEIIALDGKVTGFKRADFWTDLFHRRKTSETLSILVARMGGRIIGYALGEVRSWPVRAPACGWLYAIGVDKEHRLHKAASALFEAMVHRFKASGVGAIRTMIDVDDHLLMSFLRSFGMTAGPFVELELTFEPD
jgi:ribosomal protein S18 acetylase RimI-like enzyme